MVTTNANDSRPRESHSRDYNNRNSQNKPMNKGERTFKNERPYSNNRNEKSERGEKSYSKGPNRNYNKTDKPYNKSERTYGDKPYAKSDRPRNDGERSFNRGDRPFNKDRKPNSFGGGANKGRDPRFNSYGKDDDLDGNRFGKGSGKDQRMTKSSSKDKEVQPDKFVAAKRLEKEKKAMQKKTMELKKEKQNRPQMKKKRSNNIDWTRGYENGLYGDDDDDYTTYL